MIGLEQILMRILIAGDMKIWVYFNGKKYFLSFIVQYLQKEDWIRLKKKKIVFKRRYIDIKKEKTM